jgi:hypothetical protein
MTFLRITTTWGIELSQSSCKITLQGRLGLALIPVRGCRDVADRAGISRIGVHIARIGGATYFPSPNGLDYPISLVLCWGA